MCGTCGCDDGAGGAAGVRIGVPGEADGPAPNRPYGHEGGHGQDGGHAHGHGPGSLHDHAHGPGHGHDHEHGQDGGHGHEHGRAGDDGDATVTLEQRVLAKNELLAEENRAWLAERGVVAVNLMSSPGAGKTTLLERTVRDLAGRREVAVVEGDQETMLDADRIKRAGCAVVQVNTGAGCHLDAEMVRGALTALSPAPGSLVLVENVGNLVCPALFDLGERSKVVIISVTEGTDKPLKYPYMFAAADLVLINKTDLLPYVDFDVDRCAGYARSISPGVRVLPVSATTGEGLDEWYAWVARQYGPDPERAPVAAR
ncbi:hydrogenase nickel incorporation protein HypB [Streptomyces sp. 8L]|uniref:hydrogenase nickel incorporation protein HypB n=1 Tax=Streptomyces sp. 8L TaxID=2877242 RepID=UPI001CD7A4E3|nr:hydrogenase nickel incorporation protein HypB [Streptomyces sp. 8L]MCA1220383.1 hydrogenase nickel incorporation protein HypB [Streptomyces sp. 8L]